LEESSIAVIVCGVIVIRHACVIWDTQTSGIEAAKIHMQTRQEDATNFGQRRLAAQKPAVAKVWRTEPTLNTALSVLTFHVHIEDRNSCEAK
jgi:hypothetical protein